MDQYAVSSSFFFHLYGAAWRLAKPFLRRARRLADGWAERLVPEDSLRTTGGRAGAVPWAGPADVWIQAASGGEAYLAVALLRDLSPLVEATSGKLRVLFTTWTRQGRDVLEKEARAMAEEKPWLSVEVRFAPLDDPATARRAVEMVKPKLLALLETELWPGLMAACAETGVPVHVFNARMTWSSFEWYKVIRPVLRRLSLCRVHAITGDDAGRFARIFHSDAEDSVAGAGLGGVPCHVDVMPNIKFARAVEAVRQPLDASFVPLFQGASPVLLLASVRKQEETRLAPLLDGLFRQYPRAAVVLAPRHMHRVRAWMERLYDMGLRPMAASALSDGHGECHPPTGGLAGRMLVWDRFGDLPRLYAVADAVFVGGSFGLGGQNFLEALASGVVPCVGPSLENFRWALGEDSPPSLVDAGLLRVCSSPRKLAGTLTEGLDERLAAGNAGKEEVRVRFQEWVAPRTGGSALAARLIMEALGR